LQALAEGLAGHLPAAVFVVHMMPGSPSVLPRILDCVAPLPAKAADGEPVGPGCVYVARPDLHLLLEDGRMRLVRGPTKENRSRPAVDATMRSASARTTPCPREIGPLVGLLAGEEAPDEGGYPVPDEMELEARTAKLDPGTAESVRRLGTVSSYTCPECDGPLWELRGGDGFLRFRCRVGHAYAAEDMLEEKLETLESALWAALNTLKENAELSRRLAENSRGRGHARAIANFEERAENAERQDALISRALAEIKVNDPLRGSSKGAVPKPPMRGATGARDGEG